MKTKINAIHSFAAASALALAMGMPAETAEATIMLAPDDATATCDVNSNLGSLDAINACFGTSYSDLTFGYKQNVDDPWDTGPYAGFYTTEFSNTVDDPADALITWDGPDFFDCPTCVLIIKDGDQTPAQYLFDLLAWDGKESIQMTGFWPRQGAISHVEIWSGSRSSSSTSGQTSTGGQVPEPGVLGLLGIGLLGQAVLLRQRRRRQQK
jgi:hypothetical protein